MFEQDSRTICAPPLLVVVTRYSTASKDMYKVTSLVLKKE